MALYAIGDPHLSLSTNKPMDVFGPLWENYVERLKEGFSTLSDDDVCVICGDLSWAMSLEEAVEDLKFIDSLPGTKYVLKGNHDYWWATLSKANAFFQAHDIKTIRLIHNNFYEYGDYAICGTRGWFYEEETHGEHDKKIMNRELMRLEASLKAAGEREKLCFLHYPPRYNDYVCWEIVELFRKYDVKLCCYGHIHSLGHRFAINGIVDGVDFKMVSADYIGFKPLKILP